MSEVIVRERYLKNGKKVYEYCFELAHEGGKRRRRTKSGFATKREARAAGRQALYEYENVGEVVVDNNISYSDFLDFWIENDCKNAQFRGFSLTTEVKTSINNEVGITVYGYPTGIGASENRKIKFTVKIQRRNF